MPFVSVRAFLEHNEQKGMEFDAFDKAAGGKTKSIPVIEIYGDF